VTSLDDVLAQVDEIIGELPPGEKLVTQEEAGILVGKRSRTIKSWVEKGYLVAAFRGRRRNYYRVRDVWEAERRARKRPKVDAGTVMAYSDS